MSAQGYDRFTLTNRRVSVTDDGQVEPPITVPSNDEAEGEQTDEQD